MVLHYSYVDYELDRVDIRLLRMLASYIAYLLYCSLLSCSEDIVNLLVLVISSLFSCYEDGVISSFMFWRYGN